MRFPKPVTIENLTTNNNLRFRHKVEVKKNGKPVEVRASGKVHTWKTRPEEFSIPVKYGLYQSFKITHETADNWEII